MTMRAASRWLARRVVVFDYWLETHAPYWLWLRFPDSLLIRAVHRPVCALVDHERISECGHLSHTACRWCER